MRNAFLTENDVLSEKDFKSPDSIYAPSYNWLWNGSLSHEETDKQLDEFERLGIKSFCIIAIPKSFRPNSMPSLLTPDYLTKSYFEEYKYAVCRAKEKGMRVWLYDEGGWPSGGACGKVIINHPDYAPGKLECRARKLAGDEVYKASGDVISACIDNKTISDGFTAKGDCTIKEYFKKIVRSEASDSPGIPDITRKEAVDYFIEITHEGYKPYLEEFFGDTMPAVFTDEPKGPSPIPFRDELEDEFFKRNGYSIRSYIPELLSDGSISEQGAAAKIAWLDMCADILCKNYYLNEKAWSNQNGMLFTGHVDGDHSAECGFAYYGHYHLMRVLRCFDIPGIDVIWRHIFPTYKSNGRDINNCNNGIFPRYASSAAAQTGSRRILTESMNIYGAGTTFNDMRYVLGYQAVRGINLFNIFGTAYSRKGFHMTGCMPLFTEKHACYRDLPHFNSFAERLSYLASLGERVADVAYYMPVNDFWVEGQHSKAAREFEKLGKKLEDENLLFDVIDDDVLGVSADSASRGIISMGKAKYTTVIMPLCNYISEKSITVLNRFIQGGGKVFIVSNKAIPGILGAAVTESTEGIVPKALDISGETQKIRLGVRQAANGKLYILFNESTDKKTFCVDPDLKFVRLFAENGRIVMPKNHEITLECGESAFLFDGKLDCENETVFTECTELDGTFMFRRTERFTIGEMEFSLDSLSDPWEKVEIGDWTDITGIGFSGSCIYRTTFRKPKASGNILLDLGEVRYSCEVFVNNTSLGVLAMSPYSIEIPAKLLLDDNSLVIRVTNTAANEYESTKSFDKWTSRQLSPYHETQKAYHKEYLSGGLIGPVKIKY